MSFKSIYIEFTYLIDILTFSLTSGLKLFINKWGTTRKIIRMGGER
jgi:hypothetical protein